MDMIIIYLSTSSNGLSYWIVSVIYLIQYVCSKKTVAVKIHSRKHSITRYTGVFLNRYLIMKTLSLTVDLNDLFFELSFISFTLFLFDLRVIFHYISFCFHIKHPFILTVVFHKCFMCSLLDDLTILDQKYLIRKNC